MVRGAHPTGLIGMKNINVKLILFILISSFFLIACGSDDQQEKSMIFYDQFLKREMIKRLDEKKIEYRKKGDAIWYSITLANEVNKIYEDVLAQRPVEYKFYDQEMLTSFTSLLQERGVNFELISDENGTYVYIPKEHQKLAEKILKQSVNNN
jgi:hypothetical protein